MDAIITKYHGPSHVKGARISASVSTRRIYIPYPHELRGLERHEAAARALLEAIGLPRDTELFVGEIKNGFVFVQFNEAE